MTETTILGRLGRVLYWMACAAALMLVVVGAIVVVSPGPDWLQWAFTYFGLGVLIWLVGRAIRYILANE